MKTNKTQRLINALRKGTLTVKQIATRFRIPNVYAVIDDIRKVWNLNVTRTRTRTGLTAYTLA